MDFEKALRVVVMHTHAKEKGSCHLLGILSEDGLSVTNHHIISSNFKYRNFQMSSLS